MALKLAFIGGTRFIGHASAAAAVWRGHQVTVLHRGAHPSEVEGARSVLVDRDHPQDLISALMSDPPDVLVDTRAMTRPQAEVTALAAKCLELPCVVLSSQDVYAQFGALLGHEVPTVEPIITERSPLTLPFPYRDVAPHEAGPDYDKKEVERVFEAALGDGVPRATVLRLPPTYGARDYRRRFGWVVDPLDAGQTDLLHQGGATFRWTHAHVRDVAHAIVLAAERMPEGFRVYNVGEPVTPPMHDRVATIARFLDRSIRWIETSDPLPGELAVLGAMAADIVVDSTLIREELGFREVTTSSERMTDLVRWLRASRS